MAPAMAFIDYAKRNRWKSNGVGRLACDARTSIASNVMQFAE